MSSSVSTTTNNTTTTRKYRNNNNSVNNNTYMMQQQLRTLERRLNSPKTDLLETPNLYVVRMELPVKSYNWQIKDNRFLLVTGTKEREDLGDNVREVYRETRYGPVTRRVKLPGEINKLNAVFEEWKNGVLTLHFERVQTPPPPPPSTPVDARVGETTVIDFNELNQQMSNISWADDAN